MKPDPKLRAALEPAWSEVREQRLLGRIGEARRHRTRARRRGLALAGALAVACGAAAVLVVTLRRPAPAPTAAMRGATEPAASRLTLADGSQATLSADGNVQIEEQSAARVRLHQRAGGARYVVAHNPARDFVVTAAGVTIRVRGTIFSVAIGADAVAVRVERGRVEISDQHQTRDLVAGESLSLPIGGTASDQPSSKSSGEPSTEATEATQESAASPGTAHAAPAPARAGEPARRVALARPASPPSAADLLSQADEARAAGHPADAAHALEAFVAAYPRERRIPAALFTLGRVEAARGRRAAAAAAFERCAEARRDGPLVEDALAEAAQSWHAAGVADRARAAARAYLAAHPAGLHAAAMRALAGP
ncbi:MAG TPA: FecR family protein [Polyangia bacterium]|jgi:transmembrane sensor